MSRKLHFVLFACLCCSLMLAVPAVAKEDASAKKGSPDSAAAHSVKSAPKAAKSTPKAAKTAPGNTVPQEVVQREFETFAKEWVAKLNKSFTCSLANKELVNRGGKFICRYQEVEGGTVELSLSKTDSAQTPFVGTMRYLETIYESEGDSASVAQSGPFTPVKSTQITEIFRYTNKRWIY